MKPRESASSKRARTQNKTVAYNWRIHGPTANATTFNQPITRLGKGTLPPPPREGQATQ